MDLEVVIATYNRSQKAIRLANQILECDNPPRSVFIVDSSDQLDYDFDQKDSRIRIIKSRHKSQPYQRYLGLRSCNSEVVVFFDDDLIITDNQLFSDLRNAYSRNGVVGVSWNTNYQTVRKLKSNKGFFGFSISNFLYQIIGYRFPKPGRIGIGGFAGPMPKESQMVERFMGNNMSFRKEVAAELFDPYLFYLFEKRMALGEDKVISVRANKFGSLYFLFGDFLLHPPEESHYQKSRIQFIRNNYFSRLWVSKEVLRVKGQPLVLAYTHYLFHIISIFLASLISFDFQRATGVLWGALLNLRYNKLFVRGIKKRYMNSLEKDLSASRL